MLERSASARSPCDSTTGLPLSVCRWRARGTGWQQRIEIAHLAHRQRVAAQQRLETRGRTARQRRAARLRACRSRSPARSRSPPPCAAATARGGRRGWRIRCPSRPEQFDRSCAALMPLACRPPMIAPMEVPVITSTGACSRSSSLSTPTCQPRRAAAGEHQADARALGGATCAIAAWGQRKHQRADRDQSGFAASTQSTRQGQLVDQRVDGALHSGLVLQRPQQAGGVGRSSARRVIECVRPGRSPANSRYSVLSLRHSSCTRVQRLRTSMRSRSPGCSVSTRRAASSGAPMSVAEVGRHRVPSRRGRSPNR